LGNSCRAAGVYEIHGYYHFISTYVLNLSSNALSHPTKNMRLPTTTNIFVERSKSAIFPRRFKQRHPSSGGKEYSHNSGSDHNSGLDGAALQAQMMVGDARWGVASAWVWRLEDCLVDAWVGTGGGSRADGRLYKS